MTSLSLKKHQTIRLSTLGAIEPRHGLVTAVAVVVLACWSASLQAAPLAGPVWRHSGSGRRGAR